MCQCSSCKYTDSFQHKGFAEWPRGKPAGRSANADYAAHVRFSMSGGIQRLIPESAFNVTGEKFYGTPAGMTARKVREVLNRSFGIDA